MKNKISKVPKFLILLFILGLNLFFYSEAFARVGRCDDYINNNPNGICVELIAPFENPEDCKGDENCGRIVGETSNDFIQNYIGQIYKYAAYLIGAISIMMIVIGGIQIAVSGASQDQQSRGKDRITAALAGLILFFTAGLILYTINPNFFKMQKDNSATTSVLHVQSISQPKVDECKLSRIKLKTAIEKGLDLEVYKKQVEEKCGN